MLEDIPNKIQNKLGIVSDLDKESFDIFRREALQSGRMTKEDLTIHNEEHIMVKFKALRSVNVTEKVTEILITKSEEKVLIVLRENPAATY